MKENSETKVLTHWHQLFGAFLACRMPPADIWVEVDVPFSIESPDFNLPNLVCNEMARLKGAQRAGRDTSKRRIRLEFRYFQSLDLESAQEALIFDVLYRKTQRLSAKKVCTFLVCCKRPAKKALETFHFELSTFPGVYRNNNIISERISLICLDDLPKAIHKAFKLFASRAAISDDLFDHLSSLSQELADGELWCANVLRLKWPRKGADKPEITEKEIMKFGKSISKAVISRVSIPVRLVIPVKELADYFNPLCGDQKQV